MVGNGNQDVVLMHTDASSFAEIVFYPGSRYRDSTV